MKIISNKQRDDIVKYLNIFTEYDMCDNLKDKNNKRSAKIIINKLKTKRSVNSQTNIKGKNNAIKFVII